MTRDTSATQFVSDLAARLGQLQSIATAASGTIDGVWLGGLFQPEAYITATRQDVAHKHGWSLEQLVLQLSIDDAVTQGTFTIRGK